MRPAQASESDELRRRLDDRERFATSSRISRARARPVASGWVALYRAARAAPPRATTTTLFSGQRMHSVLPEMVSTKLYLYGFFESSLTRALLALLRPGMVFADVGSHIGYFSVLAHRLVGDHGRVYAFEPTPSTFKVLSRNVSGLRGVRAENLAVFSRADDLAIHDFGLRDSAFNSLLDTPRGLAVGGRTPVGRQLMVRGVRLDDYFQEAGVAPDFVKIDAESTEIEVLHGMQGLLVNPKPIVSVEVGDFDIGEAPRSRYVVDYLRDRGYKCFECREGGLVPHQPRQRYGYDNLIFIPK